MKIKEYIPYQYTKLENSLKFKIYIKEKDKVTIFNNNIDKLLTLEENTELLDNFPPWVDVHFYEDNISIESLSSGEKSLFHLLINLMYQVKNINQLKKYNTINLFLDETELGLHPNWQKKYLSEILYVLKQINKKQVNLFFLTHSPFLLSDLPTENIIFLKDGKQVKGIEKKQTFGANIHTLLSDGFFMKDNLMGEFAFDKIQKIVKFYNNVKNALETEKEYNEVKDEFYFIRDNIGEEYIRDVITNHIEYIEEKLGDTSFKDRRIEQLEQELKKLKANNDKD